jgi:hypothetical protein
MNNIEEQFETACNEIKILDIRNSESPPVLFHYTPAASFLSIVDSGSFWATDHRYLNDSAEFQYGLKIFAERLEHWRGHVSSINKELLQTLLQSQQDWLTSFRLFLTCFCKNGTLLSQWRGYGHKDGSFSLGLETQQLSSAHLSKRYSGLELFEVVYCRKTQVEIADRLISRLCKATDQFASSHPRGHETVVKECAHAFLFAATVQVVRFKDWDFHEEGEWRLILFVPAEKAEPKFRASRFGLTPYCELDLRADEGAWMGRLPLPIVNVGPNVEQHLAQSAVKEFLNRRGYGSTNVEASAVSLRV